MLTDQPIILIDDRECHAGVADVLRACPDLDVRVRHLTTGDYVIPGRLQIERKTVLDFAQSLFDGRLFTQAIRMRARHLPGILIIEGPSRPPSTFGLTRQALQGALVTLSVVLGLPVLRAANACETADLIRFSALQIARHNRGAPARPGYRPTGRRRRQLFILQGLPGIGPHRAEALLDAFGSVARVCQADADELAAVSGIGPHTAERLVNILNANAAVQPVAARPIPGTELAP
ncbi:MAG: nuclease [Lentisphaerae bacterium]|nr:nuclease [Lentisphaerota bacterium]